MLDPAERAGFSPPHVMPLSAWAGAAAQGFVTYRGGVDASRAEEADRHEQ